MKSPKLISLFLALLWVAPLSAQSSQFGSRGLGLPGRGVSVASLATGGALGLFDPRSSTNPAALGLLNSATTVITSTQGWRTSESPLGSGSTREHRFPHILIGGPIPSTSIGMGISFSNYAARDFLLVSSGTDSPRGVPVEVVDSVGSTGGLNDLRIGAGWTLRPNLQIGAGVHMLTGNNRLFSTRVWADSTFVPARQEAELSYLGFGVSAGAVYRPRSDLMLAASIRNDGSLDVERDSVSSGSVALPLTLMAAARYQIGNRLALAGQVVRRSWADANDDVIEQGGIGAANTTEFSAGLEMIRNLRRPEHLPLRLGIRSAQLPFLLSTGSQPKELGVSIGSGFRFAGDLGGIDFTLERARRTQGTDFTETAWQLSIGVTLRGLLQAQ